MGTLHAHRFVHILIALAVTIPGSAALADLSVGGTDDKGGSIAGVIKFEGVKKPRPVLVMAGDPYCVKVNPGPVLDERWVFGKDDGIANVLVQVVKGPSVDGKKFKAPDKPFIVDQVGCMYTPRVSAVVAGQKVQFRNSDATLHNVNILAKINPAENFGQPVKDMVGDTKLTKPEDAVMVICNVHAWMRCHVHLLPHPYFAVTDADGRFKIKGLAPGDYELKVWHEMKTFQPKEGSVLKVTVADGKEAKFDQTLVVKKAE